MKNFDLEFRLIHATPGSGPVDTTFTERVMRDIVSTSLGKAVHNAKESKQKSLLFRLRHLPKFAIVILAVAAIFSVSGITYAIVETIKQVNQNVKVEKSGTNQFGREQLTVGFDSCKQESATGGTYELKENSGLSAEDGAKVLQARCDLDFIDSWIQKDQQASGLDNTFPDIASTQGAVGTLKSNSNSEIILRGKPAFFTEERDETFPFPEGARVIEGNKVVSRDTLKAGDTLLYYSPRLREVRQSSDAPSSILVFKLNLPPKYYGLDMRSYIRARMECSNNPMRTCLRESSINSVTLVVAHGGAWIDPNNNQTIKNVQGKVVSWNASEMKLDVGKGVIYTFRTNKNVIDIYNQTTVYGLKSYDNIYANTDPEALKIGAGDSLDIYYQEEKDQSSPTIEWSKTLTISLMVERTVKDLNVLRKY